jgi:hypothetical protein
MLLLVILFTIAAAGLATVLFFIEPFFNDELLEHQGGVIIRLISFFTFGGNIINGTVNLG